MKYAVIQTGGKQYRVSEGDTVTVEKLSSLISPIKEGETVIFDKVLLTDDGTATQVGAPYLVGAKVVGTLVSEKKGICQLTSCYLRLSSAEDNVALSAYSSSLPVEIPLPNEDIFMLGNFASS